MKILYVIHALPVGGAERIVVSYIKKLKEKGVDICLLEINHEDSFLTREIEKVEIPYYTLMPSNFISRLIQRFNPTYYSKRLNTIINELSPDIVHFQTLTRYMRCLDFPMQRCVYTFHSRIERTCRKRAWAGRLLYDLARSNIQFIGISSLIEEDVKNFYPCARFVYIPNGVDLSKIRKVKKEDKRNLRKELGISEDAFVLGQVGRFNKVKNHMFTIEVFRDLQKINNKVCLIFVGDGSKQEISDIREAISMFNLEDKVKFLGIRTDAEMVMTCFDALIQPSFSESFSLVLIEAQANSIRCVVSDAIPKEIVCNENCIQLSLTDSREKWVNAILGKNVSHNTNNIEVFNINSVINTHISLYNDLINQ